MRLGRILIGGKVRGRHICWGGRVGWEGGVFYPILLSYLIPISRLFLTFRLKCVYIMFFLRVREGVGTSTEADMWPRVTPVTSDSSIVMSSPKMGKAGHQESRLQMVSHEFSEHIDQGKVFSPSFPVSRLQ